LKNITVFTLLLSLAIAQVSFSQSLTRTDFTSVLAPQYVGSGTTTRLPVVFRAKLTSLTAGKLYRYIVQAGKFSDIGTTNTGAGNTLFMNPDSAASAYTTGPALTTAGNYSVFRANSSGEYTGWFAFVNTGNARFTPGTYIFPTIAIGDSTGAVVARRALSDSMLVLGFSSQSTDTAGTGCQGSSSGTGRNLMVLYGNTDGSGRPLTIALIENDGITIASSVQFYTDNVNGKAGFWGSIIPNKNVNGVQRLEHRSLSDGTLLTAWTSASGIWANSVSTINPAGGTTALRIDTLGTNPTEIQGQNISRIKQFTLEQNYPNPFNPSTMIQFTVPQTSHAKLTVANALGQEVRILFDGIASAGQSYSVNFAADGLASGIYYYTLQNNGSSLTKKMILLQ
jgi:hypothetical protein